MRKRSWRCNVYLLLKKTYKSRKLYAIWIITSLMSCTKTVYVSAVHRLTEHDTKRVRQLVSKALIM